MKNTPDNLNPLEAFIIMAEGLQAYQQGQQRSSNPYADKNEKLAAVWWKAWDAAEAIDIENRPPSKDE